MKSEKQQLIEAGYLWIKPENVVPGSALRILFDPRSQKYWIVRSTDEAVVLAGKLLEAA